MVVFSKVTGEAVMDHLVVDLVDLTLEQDPLLDYLQIMETELLLRQILVLVEGELVVERMGEAMAVTVAELLEAVGKVED